MILLVIESFQRILIRGDLSGLKEAAQSQLFFFFFYGLPPLLHECRQRV